VNLLFFSAQQHIAYMLSALSVTRVYHTKTVEVRIIKFSPYGSPITSFCRVSLIQKF